MTFQSNQTDTKYSLKSGDVEKWFPSSGSDIIIHLVMLLIELLKLRERVMISTFIANRF